LPAEAAAAAQTAAATAEAFCLYFLGLLRLSEPRRTFFCLLFYLKYIIIALKKFLQIHINIPNSQQ
jgi:hypothetical protein